MRSRMLAALPALALGCALAPRTFAPAENATLPAPGGGAAAQYDVEGEGGELAHVEVWSGGVYRAQVDGEARTLVEVTLRLEPGPGRDGVLIRDALVLDAVQTGQRRLRDVPPVRVDREVLQDGEGTEYTAFFALPADVRPGDVVAFRLRWQVLAGEVTYLQRTPFLEDLPPPYLAWSWGPAVLAWPFGYPLWHCGYPPWPRGYPPWSAAPRPRRAPPPPVARP
jgi:hypothetical protein